MHPFSIHLVPRCNPRASLTPAIPLIRRPERLEAAANAREADASKRDLASAPPALVIRPPRMPR